MYTVRVRVPGTSLWVEMDSAKAGQAAADAIPIANAAGANITSDATFGNALATGATAMKAVADGTATAGQKAQAKAWVDFMTSLVSGLVFVRQGEG